MLSRSRSKAKLNSTRMTSANEALAFSDSLVRSSVLRSLRAIESAARSPRFMPRDGSLGLSEGAVKPCRIGHHFGSAGTAVYDFAVLEQRHVACEIHRFTNLVSRHHDGGLPRPSVRQNGLQNRDRPVVK